jgi:RNA-binding protein
VVQVGKGGGSPGVFAELDAALAVHEVVKVRLGVGRDDKQALAEQLATRAGAELAGVVGFVAILYRPHPDPAQRRIRLPASGE